MSRVFDDLANEIVKAQKIKFAKRMIARGKLSLEEIAEVLDLPLSAVRELAEKKSA